MEVVVSVETRLSCVVRTCRSLVVYWDQIWEVEIEIKKKAAVKEKDHRA